MMKKGLSYVDWVISLGTFLIAVIFIFILIRPQFEPKKDNENLMQLVETGFYEDTEWTTRETPVFIKKLQDYYMSSSGPKPAKVIIDYASTFQAKVIQAPPSSHMRVTAGNPITIECISGICTNEKLVVVFSPLNPQNRDYPGITMRCQPPDAMICDASVGATTTISGLNEQQLASLSTQGYTTLKKKWNYPTLNEFALVIDNANIVSSPLVPQQASVYVKERKYWKLKENNQREPITIRFQVW